MTAIAVKAAHAGDLNTIRNIVNAAYSKWIPLIGREPRPMAADYEMAIETHQFDLLQVGGETVGLIETFLVDGYLWIENIAVWPEDQGRGYGSLLIAHAGTRASAAGVKELRLLTNEMFASNIALYAKAGFAIDRKEPFMGGTTVYMSKKLR